MLSQRDSLVASQPQAHFRRKKPPSILPLRCSSSTVSHGPEASAGAESLGQPTNVAKGPASQAQQEAGMPGWIANRGCAWEDRRFPSGRGFLEAMPHGAYTTTRTIHKGTRVLMWEFHVARILDSLQRLHAAHPDLFPHSGHTQPHSHLTQPHSPPPSDPLLPALPLLQQEVASCCQLAWAAVRDSDTWQALTGAEADRRDGLSGQEGIPQVPEIMFTVLICGRRPRQEQTQQPHQPPQAPQQQQTQQPQQPQQLQGKGQEEMGFETHSDVAGQSERRAFEVYVHASVFLAPEWATWATDRLDRGGAAPMGMGHVAPLQGCRVAVMGPPRTVPLAKFSEWPTRRRVLERCKPKGAREVLLSPDGDLLLEGLITNFFVIGRRRSSAHQGSGNPDSAQSPNAAQSQSLDGIEIVTAPLEGFGVLPGTIRRVLLGVFESRGVPVVLEAPRLEDRESWVGAFVTKQRRKSFHLHPEVATTRTRGNIPRLPTSEGSAMTSQDSGYQRYCNRCC